MVIIGLDCGNGQTKINVNGKIIVLPSELAILREEGEKGDVLDFGTSQMYRCTSPKDKKIAYGVGEGVIFSDNVITSYTVKNRYAKESFRTLVECVIGVAMKESGLNDAKVTVVTGVPSVELGTVAEKDILAAIMGVHMVTIDGEPITYEVVKGIVLPQPLGTYFCGLFNENGEITKQGHRLLASNVIIVDSGSGTTCIECMRNGAHIEEFQNTIRGGSRDIFKYMQRAILLKYPYLSKQITIEKIEQYVKDGVTKKFEISKQIKINVEDLYEQACNNFAEKLINQIDAWIENPDAFDRIILTGGTMEMVGKQLKSYYKSSEILNNEHSCQVMNVLGFTRFGMHYCNSKGLQV